MFALFILRSFVSSPAAREDCESSGLVRWFLLRLLCLCVSVVLSLSLDFRLGRVRATAALRWHYLLRVTIFLFSSSSSREVSYNKINLKKTVGCKKCVL